jgi:glycosyltransferase involved in cell wall biosynthesis
MRIKILDFLSRGLPTVATSIGAEGIPSAWEGEPVLELADDPGAFLVALEKLAGCEAHRTLLAANGRRFVATEYDWKTLMARFCSWAVDPGMCAATGSAGPAPGVRAVPT